MFGKRLHELTKDDIERLVAEAVQEDGEIEFKETLPARKGRDAWLDGGDRIGERARNEIIEEVIRSAAEIRSQWKAEKNSFPHFKGFGSH